jgi:prolyl oligopeptidase
MAILSSPRTKAVLQIDDYHGTPVPDPYRWLEETDAPETREWIEAENRVTFSFLEKIPGRDRIRDRLTELWDYGKQWAPLKKGGRFFQTRNTGLQNQDVLYTMKSPRDKGRVLLDPNTLSPDGTVSLIAWSVSRDGRWLAYATSSVGSDWLTWRVLNVTTGKDLPDVLEWSKFSGAEWLPDSSGFYYGRYEPPAGGTKYTGPNYFQKLFFHRVKTPQRKDDLVYHRPDQKEWGFGPVVSDDGRYLVLFVWQGTDSRNRVFYKDLKTDAPVVELIPELEAAYHFVGNDGPVFYFRTDLDAPRGRLIAVDVTRPERSNWTTLIEESKDTLEGVQMVHDEFVAVYLHDAHHVIQRFSRKGKFLGKIPLPTIGAIYDALPNRGFNGERGDDELFYAFHSFVHPLSVFRFDFRSGKSEVLYRPPIGFDFKPYVTRQVFVTSKDGTRVPMFLVHKKGLRKDGENPTILYGYGGFNVPLTPVFDVSRVAWFEMGGVLAWANLRGGSEYGEEWHKAGMLHAKQNTFDDFIACAEWLVKERITSTRKLAIQGRSNGGLLVGACMTQRPDLFGACLPAVGVMDMLRFHKFTIGWAWTSDYGNPDVPEDFEILYAYSPYHNIRDGVKYPATFITTSDHDDRVVPGHSFKFAARLQAAQAGDAPVLARIQTKAGHGIGRPTKFLIEENADIYAFLVKVFGVPTPKGGKNRPAQTRT